MDEIFRRANQSRLTPPGSLAGGGTALPEVAEVPELPAPSGWGRMCRVAGRAAPWVAATIEVGYWSYLAYKGEWGQLGLSVTRSTPVGEIGLGAYDVIQQASSGDLPGAGWTYAKNAVPAIGMAAWAADKLTPAGYTLKPWETEWWPF